MMWILVTLGVVLYVIVGTAIYSFLEVRRIGYYEGRPIIGMFWILMPIVIALWWFLRFTVLALRWMDRWFQDKFRP